MKLHFLGTSGYHPNRRRDTACLMIPEKGIVLDAGTGLFRARELIQTAELDIYLSHVHLDHVIGLTFLLDVLYQKNVQRVRVHCDPAKQAAIRDHLYHPQLFPVPPPFEFRNLGPGSHRLSDGGQLQAFPLEHPGGCLGFRFDWPGHSVAYVTDTTAHPNAGYIQPLKRVDLLIHECYFPDGFHEQAALTGHSCLTAVAEVAQAAAAKRLRLVHLNPLDEEANGLDLTTIRTLIPDVAIAADGETIEF